MTPVNEEWRPTHLKSWYEISDQGRVRNTRTGKILKQQRSGRPTDRGYYEVHLGMGVLARIHVLVCWAFNGPRPTPEHQVAHSNGDSLDNRPSNLRWATARENTQDSVRHGTWNRPPRLLGSQHAKAKVSEDDVREIRRLAGSVSQRQLARDFGVSRSAIQFIVHRKAWRHVA